MGCIPIVPAAGDPGETGSWSWLPQGNTGYPGPNFIRISQPVLLVCALFPLGKHEVTGEARG